MFGYSVTQHNYTEDVDLNVFQLVTVLEAQKETSWISPKLLCFPLQHTFLESSPAIFCTDNSVIAFINDKCC